MRRPASLALTMLLALASTATAQRDVNVDSLAAARGRQVVEGVAPSSAQPPQTVAEKVDIITPHITDGYHLEYPCWDPAHGFACHVDLSEHFHWVVNLGGYQLDLTPTRHVVFMLLAATIVTLLLVGTAVAHKRHHHESGRPRGFAAGMEAIVLFLRNEVVLPNVGPHGNAYVPFVLTLFFFILTANLLGLIPYGSTATGNISVTGMLAIITFIVVEAAGMRAQGVHYLNTMFYWNKELALPMRLLMFVIMSPVEIFGKFTKPFALAIRLFANMTAGHILVLALIGLIFMFRGVVAGAPFLMAVAIMILELFVAFLQAFIFSLLASVFIGQMREAHH